MNYNPTIDIKAKVGRPTNIKLHQNIESLLVDNKSYDQIQHVLSCSRTTIAKVSKRLKQRGV
ncbi:[weak similarity to] resolvease/recombinase, partial [methanotrophic bacterial endosymbiont of Bathymodiolus sp.]